MARNIYKLSLLHFILQILIIYHARGQDDNKVDEEDDQNRYIKDDSFKPAIFGSSAYDPIKGVFEPVKHHAHSTTESEGTAKNHTGGSTMGNLEGEGTSTTVQSPKDHDAGRARDPFFRQRKFELQNFSLSENKPTNSDMYVKQRLPLKSIKRD